MFSRGFLPINLDLLPKIHRYLLGCPPSQGDNITNRMFIFLHFGDLKLHLHLPHVRRKTNADALPETNIAHENTIFPGKYHQNGGFSMAMLVSGSVFCSAFSLPRWKMATCNASIARPRGGVTIRDLDGILRCRSLRGISTFVRLVRE